MTDRYAEKPFLRLLDAYVLDSIGALDVQSSDGLRAMEPKLRETYRMQGTWQEIVAAQMQFPDDLPEKIREIWEAGSKNMRDRGMQPDPVEFTHQFVDTNFSQDQ